MQPHVVLALVACAGCARGVQVVPEADAPAGGDARGSTDAPAPPPIDAPVASSAVNLLLTEAVLAPSNAEFIELVNAGSTPVNLSTFYLSDHGTYFRLPAGGQALDTADFIVRFPSGATLAAGAVVTVALDTAANFTTAYGIAPTYSIASGTMTTVASNGVPSLTNGGELIALFSWDGQADLVEDVDLMIVGGATAANGLVDKSGVALDGPDAGSGTSTYATDAGTVGAQPSTPAAGKSTKRIGLETGHETHAGTGNGLGGDDETSEDTAATWDASGFTAPTPGSVPTALLP